MDFQLTQKIKIVNKTGLGRQIVEEILNRINRFLPSVLKEVKVFTTFYIERAIKNSRTYNSLISGPLQAHFGLVNPAGDMDQIISSLKNLVKVDHEPFKIRGNQYQRNITGNVTLSIIGQENNLRKLLNSPGARYDSHGGPVDWLEWLLFEGGNTVVFDYGIKFGNFPLDYSRTGRAIMIPDLRGYEVPFDHSGTESDNFITRALRDIEDELDRVFKINLNKLQ